LSGPQDLPPDLTFGELALRSPTSSSTIELLRLQKQIAHRRRADLQLRSRIPVEIASARSATDMKNLVFRSCDPVTRRDFAEWVESVSPDDLHHYELLDGFVVREPPAGWPHGELEIEIGRRLATFVKSRRLGRTFGSSQGFSLPSGDVVEPDVSFVCAERWRAAQPLGGFLTVVPDLVFEILSPSTESIDRGQKKRIYERNGVREYVLLDAEARTLEQFGLVEEGARFDGGRVLGAGETFASRVLPGLVIPVGELFADL